MKKLTLKKSGLAVGYKNKIKIGTDTIIDRPSAFIYNNSMPRTARIVIPGYPYHITQRGNYRQEIFQDDEDREKYLSWIEEYSQKHDMAVYAYSLMNNHVHFIVKPMKEDTLAKTFSAAHMRYSQYFNKKMKEKGHLWQGRFYSCILEDEHLHAAVRYVEKNPVRAKFVKKPWDWEWSSARAHVGMEDNSVLKMADISEILDLSKMDWKEYIDGQEDQGEIKELRRYTMLGRPWGGLEFVKKLSEKFGIKIPDKPRGRPKKRDK